MLAFSFGIGLIDSGDTATHACFLLQGLFNRQLSPEETRGHIGPIVLIHLDHPSLLQDRLDRQVSPREDPTDGWAAMPVFRFDAQFCPLVSSGLIGGMGCRVRFLLLRVRLMTVVAR